MVPCLLAPSTKNRPCKGCKNSIPQERAPQARYCSLRCGDNARKNDWRKKHPFSWREQYLKNREAYCKKFRERHHRLFVSKHGAGTAKAWARELGYRSGYERTLATQMKMAGVIFEYEPIKLAYVHEHVYIPDFRLPNGIIIEAKGLLDQSTRSKMLAVKRAYPDLDIRFVFMRGENTLSRNSKMTYIEWAEKNGFKAASGNIPIEWFKEQTHVGTN